MAKKKYNELDPATLTPTRLIAHANPSTGKLNRAPASELIALIASGQTPVKSYADETTMLANTDLAIGYLAYNTYTSGLYLYNGPTPGDIGNYTLLTSEDHWRGQFDSTGDLFPETGDINPGDVYVIGNIGSVLNGIPIPLNSIIIALEPNPGQDINKWTILPYGVQNLEEVLTQDNDAGGLQIKNIADGTDPQDAVSKAQLDAAALGIVSSWKTPVKVATAVAGTLATSFENGDTVDGITLVTGDRILIKNQASAIENGIYIVAASGAPARSTDANTAAELEGVAVMVQQGTAGANTTWIQTTDGITLGSSNIVWSQMGTTVPDADASTRGIAKLYTALGSNTDGAIDQNTANTNFALKAPLASPTFTGTPIVPTAAPSTNNTQVASTAYADAAVAAALSAAKSMVIAVTDEVTNIGTGTGKVSFRMPYAMTLTAVRASLVVAQASGSIFTVDINEAGSTILSTKLTIDNTETTSVSAATAAVISDTALADDAVITVDVDQIGDGSAIGLKITLIGT